MKKQLTEQEARDSRAVTELIKELPGYMKDYPKYLEKKSVSFASQRKQIQAIIILFNYIAQIRGINISDVTLEMIPSLTLKQVEEYLYEPLTMPPELTKAHQLNDAAVMKSYGFSVKDTTEADCVAELMKMYQKLTK